MWRTSRRFVHSAVNVSAARSYIPYQDLENKQMLVELLDEPHDFVSQIQRYTYSLTHQMVVGYRAISKDAPDIKEFYSILHQFSQIASSTAASLLDTFPVLKWLPHSWMAAVKQAKALRETELKILLAQWMKIKGQIQDGTAKVRGRTS